MPRRTPSRCVRTLPERRRRVTLWALLALGMVVATACGGSNGFPDPVTEQGEEAVDLWNLFLYMAIAIGVFCYLLVAFIVIRFRRRNHDDDSDQTQYAPKLEIAYTIIPLLIVGAMFFITIPTQDSITELSDNPDLVVEIVGFQWQWQFNYPDHDVTVQGVPGERPRLVLPTERTVRLELVANDVIHSFWVPHFISKRDLIPEVDNQIDVNIVETGLWKGQCAEFCGLDHWSMFFEVQAVSPDEFDAWIADQEAAATSTTMADPEDPSVESEPSSDTTPTTAQTTGPTTTADAGTTTTAPDEATTTTTVGGDR